MSVTRVVTQQSLAFAAEPSVLIGEPRRCVGIVPVHNPHKEAVKLRRLRFAVLDDALRGACRESTTLEAQAAAELCAGETRGLRVKLRLHDSTPPGTYYAQLEGAEGCSHPVEVRVLEHRKTRLSPHTFTRTTSPGESFTLPLHVTNRGNVPLEIPSRTAVELHAADRGWTFHLHRAVRARGADGNQAVLDGFVRRLGAAEPPLGRARILQGAGRLLPSESRLIELRITVPKSLRSRRKYRANVRIADATMHVALHVMRAFSERGTP